MRHTIQWHTIFILIFGALTLTSCLSDNDDYYNISKNDDPLFKPVSAPETSREACSDQLDNDLDGDIDCDDSDCDAIDVCNPEYHCDDNIDNDLDGAIDCDDSDCFDDSYCEAQEENSYGLCNDDLDNDNDLLVDCDDPDCTFTCENDGENTAMFCNDGFDNDKDGRIDCDDKDCEYYCENQQEDSYDLCRNGLDDDMDGTIDCEDLDCQHFKVCTTPEFFESTLEYCTDEKDNDGDGFTDCADVDCQPFKICTIPEAAENSPTLCEDKIDNDDDGATDCEDADCQIYTACAKPRLYENTAHLCSDGIDNDGDNAIDCDDDNCSGIAACLPSTEDSYDQCTDNVDNDGDGDIDCDDSDCDSFMHCNEVISCLPDGYTPPPSIDFEIDLYDYADGCGSDENFGCHGGNSAVLTGMVENWLGSNGLPQYKSNRWFNDKIETWWSTKDGGTYSKQHITFSYKGNNLYEYDNPNFFPLGSGNFGFAGHIHKEFTYLEEGAGKQTFDFSGDDDVFVFLNGFLVIDLGGIHEPASASFNLKTEAEKLNLIDGETVTLDFFIAERMQDGSAAKITANIPCLMVGN